MQKYLSLKKKQLLENTLGRRSRFFRKTLSSPEVETLETQSRTTSSKPPPLQELKRLIREDRTISADHNPKRASEGFLVRFLRCCDDDPEKAFGVWKSYWKLYSNLRLAYCLQPVQISSLISPQFSHGHKSVSSQISTESLKSTLRSSYYEKHVPLEIPRVAQCLSSGWIQCPPSRDRDGRQLVLMFPNRFDATTYTTSDVCAAIMNLTNNLLRSEETQLNGFCVIIDARESKPENVNIQSFRKTVFVLQRCLPVVVGKLLIIGFPTYAKALWRSTQDWLSKDLKKQAHLIEGSTSEMLGYELELYVDPSQLPSEYDGSLIWNVDESMKEWVLNELL